MIDGETGKVYYIKIKEKIEFFGYLYQRWQDEMKYEEWKDYQGYWVLNNPHGGVEVHAVGCKDVLKKLQRYGGNAWAVEGADPARATLDDLNASFGWLYHHTTDAGIRQDENGENEPWSIDNIEVFPCTKK